VKTRLKSRAFEFMTEIPWSHSSQTVFFYKWPTVLEWAVCKEKSVNLDIAGSFNIKRKNQVLRDLALCSLPTFLTETGYSLRINRHQFQIAVLASLVNFVTDGLHTQLNTVCFNLSTDHRTRHNLSSFAICKVTGTNLWGSYIAEKGKCVAWS